MTDVIICASIVTLADDEPVNRLHLPGGLVQHGFHLVYLISTKVDHSEMNLAVLLDAHFSESKNTKTHYTNKHIRSTSILIHPEIATNYLFTDKDNNYIHTCETSL